MSNHALFQVIYSEHLRPITVCPTRIKGILLLVQPTTGFDLPLTFNSFFFVPSIRLLVPLGGANSTTRFPRLLPLMKRFTAGINSSEVGVLSDCAPLRDRLLFKALFHRRNSPLAPVSSRSGCLIAPCSQLHPPETESGQCGQIRSHI